jgi:hypothetical protein
LDGNFHFLDKSTVVSVDSPPGVAAVDSEKKLTKNDLDSLISYLVSVARNSQDGVKLKTLRRRNEQDED